MLTSKPIQKHLYGNLNRNPLDFPKPSQNLTTNSAKTITPVPLVMIDRDVEAAAGINLERALKFN